jgi:hypothetical protein
MPKTGFDADDRWEHPFPRTGRVLHALRGSLSQWRATGFAGGWEMGDGRSEIVARS